MKFIFILLFSLFIVACTNKKVIANYNVIPLPQSVEHKHDLPFVITKNTFITYSQNDSLLKHNAIFLSDYIAQSTGYKLNVQADVKEEKCIALILNRNIKNSEGYHIIISQDKISVEGATAKGVFYGIQTLRKAIPAVAKDAIIELPSVEIIDEPRFEYRGMHLDVCRHFFPISFLKKYIDLLALHNMNTFHLHLTEDQGWRIEIKKYPRLTEIGSVRSRTVQGYMGSGQYDSTVVKGYYTQEQLRDLVKYAQDRHVNIIPEIDLPGHMLAALASYPELGCTGGPYQVADDWGVFQDVLCVGNENTFNFLEEVFKEVMDIFPSKYIHIGGDETPRNRWKECPKCQIRIKNERLITDAYCTAEDRLQSYCMARIERFLNAHGRNIIGWDEILDGEVLPNATVMSWRGSSGGIKAAQKKHKVIMTPNTYCYFDYYQTKDVDNEPMAIGGCIPVDKVYSFEPTEGLTLEESKYIYGVQANVWTEYISTTDYVEYMILPRMAALAEVQWLSPKRKNYKDFVRRICWLKNVYEREGVNYAKHLFYTVPD